VGSRKLSEAEQSELSLAIEAHLRQDGINVVDITTGSWLTQTTGMGFGALTGFLLFLAMLTALVGSIGLAGTMSMNVMERTREIGVMRAIGATDRELFKMVLIEGTLIGFLSWFIGSLLSFPMSYAMSDMISQSLFNTPSTFGVSANGFVIWFGVVMVLSALASILPARNATRLTIREVLAYE
jgi:putative ABC transport system permease protein